MDELQKAENAFRKAHAAGDKARAAVLAREVRRLRSQSDAAVGSQQALLKPGAYARDKAAGRELQAQREQAERDASDTFDGDLGAQFRAGIGRRMSSALRAVLPDSARQALGIMDADEAKRTDRALLETTAGNVGDAVGMAAVAAPAIPFTPATIPGAIVAGGVTGAAFTEGDLEDRLQGGVEGALGGGLGQSLPTVYRAGRGVVRGLVDSATDAGAQRVAGRTLQRFGLDPDQLATLEASGLLGQRSATGARPTLAELPGLPTNTRRGLATLQRAVGTMDEDFGGTFAARQAENNAARVDSLGVLTGTSQRPRSSVRALDRIARGQPTRQAAVGTRAGNAQQAYEGAYEAGIVPGSAEAMAPQMDELLRRPSVQTARARATEAATEMGLEPVAENTVQGLHLIKKELDAQKGILSRGGDDAAAGRVASTAGGFDDLLENLSPLYQQARRGFQFDSVPVNRADIGERLLSRTRDDVRDFGGDRAMRARSFSRALNDEGRLISDATGFRGNPNAALEDVLTATQSGTVNNVRDELEMLANLDRAANGPGSQTAKMLNAQNIVRQVAGPLGIPEGWLSNIAADAVQWPLHYVGGGNAFGAQPRIARHLSRAFLEPQDALEMLMQARAVDRVRPPTRAGTLARRAAPALIGVTAADASSK